MLTVPEVAKYLKKSEFWTAQSFRQGKFPHAQKLISAWLITWEGLQEDLELFKPFKRNANGNR